MDANLRNELLLVLANENIEEDFMRVIRNCTKFVNNSDYMDRVLKKFSELFSPDSSDVNFWVVLPKLFHTVIEINKDVDNISEIPEKDMKYVIYSVIFSYLDKHKDASWVHEGDLRVAFVNLSELILLKPKHIKVMAQKCFSSCLSCCEDDTKIHL